MDCRHDWERVDPVHVVDCEERRCRLCGMRQRRYMPRWTTIPRPGEGRDDLTWGAGYAEGAE